MKIIFFLIIAIICCKDNAVIPEIEQNIHLFQERGEGVDEEKEITKVNLLSIGNSFSDNALEHYLHGLSQANGDTIIIGNLYIGGASLETHYNNSVQNAPRYSYRKIVNGEKSIISEYTILDAIKEEKWDYISFQQVSSLSGIYESFFPYLTSLLNYVEEHSINPDVEFVLHSTWAYAQNSTHVGFANYGNDQMKMYNAIIDTYQHVAEEIGVDIIIPAGTAIQNGRTSTLGDTFCSDGYHLEPNYGRYTASCAWYEKIFKKTVIGNSYIPKNISPFQAGVAQSAAHHAVVNPYQVTSLAHLVDETPIESFTKKINISFGGNHDDPKWIVLDNDAKIDNLKDINHAYTELSVVITERFGKLFNSK